MQEGQIQDEAESYREETDGLVAQAGTIAN
jgi:hypothetical protein